MAEFEEHEVVYSHDKKIAYLASGPRSGPLLIFLHGWPGIAKTWHLQLTVFATLGFRVVAPDMPGYGMLALLADTGRDEAVWIGHDWGSGVVWSIANTHPEVFRAVATLCLPYRMLEIGLDELLKSVNREIYPEDEYPYIVFYEQAFEKATAWFEKDSAGILKALYKKGRLEDYGKSLHFTSNNVKDGGWLGGIPKPPSPEEIPDHDAALDDETFQELVAAFEKTGWFGGNSWYVHNKENREYNTTNSKHNGRLEMPVLFIHAKYDTGPESVYGTYSWPMRKLTQNLTETTIDAGHWVWAEKAEETNAAIAMWLVEEVVDWWPGFWHNGFVKRSRDITQG